MTRLLENLLAQPRRVNSRILAWVLFLFVVPTAAHLLFSWAGFNPSDDGFVLAYSRRILEGQAPHRDFISIRPVGSPLLHLPFVVFGGEYTFWLSRLFVWFEFAVISWSWIVAVEAILQIAYVPLCRVSLALVAFMFSTHTFPPMAWHTVDALFFLSIGLTLCLVPTGRAKSIGYLFIGMAYLCRQNFLLTAPATVILLKDWRRLQAWQAVMLPGLAYILFVVLAGGGTDALLQFSSQMGLLDAGLIRYVFDPFLILGFVYGLTGMLFLSRQPPPEMRCEKQRRRSLPGVLFLYFALILCAVSMARGDYTTRASFFIFGVALGLAFVTALRSISIRGMGLITTLTVLLAWSTSISIGYNTPALATGLLAILVVSVSAVAIRPESQPARIRTIKEPLVMILLAAIIVCYGIARVEFVYRDQPVSELNWPLDRVLPGGSLISSNPRTFDFLVDLEDAVAFADGQPFTIIPGIAAFWVKSASGNPIPIDWAQQTELNNPQLIDRVVGTIKEKGVVIIVESVQAESLAEGLEWFTYYEHNAVVEYVVNNCSRAGSTRYFDLYLSCSHASQLTGSP